MSENLNTLSMVEWAPHIALLPKDEGQKAIDRLSSDRIHGNSHINRLLAWYRYAIENTKLPETPHFGDFSQAGVDAIHRHDFLEVITGRKKGHRQAGALYSLAVDTKFEQDVELYGAGTEIKITREAWQKKKWATAFMILYHQPEDMPTLEQIKARGKLIDIKSIREKASPFADLFEPYRAYEAILDQLENETQPSFSDDEIEAIRNHAYLVALADKMDQLMPIEASSNRTILLNPNRPFYIYSRNHERKDYEERISNGSGDESSDTLSRMLFEMTRTKPFDQASSEIQLLYRKALHNKALFLKEGILAFLHRDFDPFIRYYDNEIVRIKENILVQLQYEQDMSKSIVAKHGDRTVGNILQQYGVDTQLLRHELEQIDMERRNVVQVLESRYEDLKKNGFLQPFHIKRITQLIERAVQVTNSGDVGNLSIREPYDTLHQFSVTSDRIQ